MVLRVTWLRGCRPGRRSQKRMCSFGIFVASRELATRIAYTEDDNTSMLGGYQRLDRFLTRALSFTRSLIVESFRTNP